MKNYTLKNNFSTKHISETKLIFQSCFKFKVLLS